MTTTAATNPSSSPAPSDMAQPRFTEARAWQFTAWAAAVFMVLLSVNMVTGHLRVRAQDPWKSPKLAQLKEQLRANPRDEAVKKQIRDLDLQLRHRYFLQMSRMSSGVYLLLGGAAVLVFSVSRLRAGKRQMPNLAVTPDEAARQRAAHSSRWAVAAVGAFAGLGLWALQMGWSSPLPEDGKQIAKLLGEDAPGGAGTAAAAASDAPSAEEFAKNWPHFLGPFGNGFTKSAGPESWDAQSGAGIVWKTPVLSHGFNSPVVWGDKVFYSGGDAEKREVICHDAKTGKLLWREALKDVPGSPAQMPEIPETTGLAAPSMATDGRRVYVIFANGDVGAFSLDGKRAWAKSFGALKNAYGHSTSLAIWRDRLIVQLDQGDKEDNKSRLYALDGRTGNVLWQKPRPFGASWASPAVFEAAGKTQIVCLSLPYAAAYSAADGAELWKADCLNGEVTPSAIFSGGLVIVPSPSEKLLAIRPDGQGDVTKTHVQWTNEDSIPDVTSPAGDGSLVFMLTTSGMLTCVDNKDGKRAWEKDFETEFHSSPAIAGGRVYLFSQKGTALVVEAARQYKELLKVEMGDSFHASPAIVDGRMFVRGVTNLWCLGPK